MNDWLLWVFLVSQLLTNFAVNYRLNKLERSRR